MHLHIDNRNFPVLFSIFLPLSSFEFLSNFEFRISNFPRSGQGFPRSGYFGINWTATRIPIISTKPITLSRAALRPRTVGFIGECRTTA
jgi:hypothetical protein